MRQRLASWLTVDHPDEDIRRRGRNIIYLSLGTILMCLVVVPVSLMPATSSARFSLLVVFGLIIAVQVSQVALARRGLVTLAGLVALPFNTLSIVGSVLGTGSLDSGPIFFSTGILIASLVFPARFLPLVFAYNVGVMLGLWYLLPASALQPVGMLSIIVSSITLAIFTVVFATLGTWSSEQSLLLVRQSRAELEHAKRLLERANEVLEQRVTERTADLQAAFATQQQQSQALQASLDTQQRLNQQVVELSIPVLPVQRDMLVAPLVGAIDGERANELLGRVLSQIEAQRARTLILDITGVAIIDTAIAQTLIQVTQAAGLLGARTALVGVRPEVAQTLVSLGVDLSTIRTEATLAQAIATM